MPEYLSPGVYVEEFESGPRPMEGVSTSTAGFIGLAERGAVEGLPELVTNFGDFQRKFGGYLPSNVFGNYRFLAYAVENFFVNGGGRCYVMRVPAVNVKAASNYDQTTAATVSLKISAKNPGSWGNKIRITITPASKAKTQIYEVVDKTVGEYRVKGSAGFNPGDVVMFYDDASKAKEFGTVKSAQDNIIVLSAPLAASDVTDDKLLPQKTLSTCEFSLQVTYKDEGEIYENVSLNDAAANYIGKVIARSNLIVLDGVNAKVTGKAHLFKDITTKDEEITDNNTTKLNSDVISLANGSDGSVDDNDSMVANFKGDEAGGPGKRTGIEAFKDNDEVSIIAIPGMTDENIQLSLVAHCELLKSRFAILDIPQDKKKVSDVQNHRNVFDTNYAAMYNPWLQVFDPLEKRNIFIPPSGSVAGIYARSDTTRGVHKAPANEVVRACTGLDCQYNKGEQDILNPKGINLIRYFTGEGIRVWGARTCSSNTLWKYVNVRRLFIFIEESIKRGTNWVVFEPNDETLWARVQRTIENFLTTVWRSGALMGVTPAEAFFVKVDRSTMSQDDIDNGRLICIIGVAPVKPAEFVIFRITQKTSEQ